MHVHVLSLLLLLGLAFASLPARAVVIVGTYSGVVTNSAGNTYGVDGGGVALAPFIGQAMTGGFSFDTASLAPAGNGSNYRRYASTVPISMYHDVGGVHHALSGSDTGIFLFAPWSPAYAYGFQVYVSGPSGSPLPNSTFSILSNSPLFSDLDSPSSIDIAPADVQFAIGQTQFGTGQSLSGMLTFSVVSSQVAPVPLPGPAALLLGGLGLLGAAARRRRETGSP